MKYYGLILILFLFFYNCDKKKTEKTENIKVENGFKTQVVQSNVKKYNRREVITKEFILGRFNYRKDTSFIKVKRFHSSKEIYLKKKVYKAFIKMYNHAKKDKINLRIISGTRNFYHQKAIWERKWLYYKDLPPKKRALKILEFSSMPSTSRHHWGTDLDLNSFNNSYFEKGKGEKEYKWLSKNAHKYGFYQVYTSKESGRKGYNMEKWHWSYLPLADEYLNFYNSNIKYKDIRGFSSNLAEKINIIEHYVNGIER